MDETANCLYFFQLMFLSSVLRCDRNVTSRTVSARRWNPFPMLSARAAVFRFATFHGTPSSSRSGPGRRRCSTVALMTLYASVRSPLYARTVKRELTIFALYGAASASDTFEVKTTRHRRNLRRRTRRETTGTTDELEIVENSCEDWNRCLRIPCTQRGSVSLWGFEALYKCSDWIREFCGTACMRACTCTCMWSTFSVIVWSNRLSVCASYAILWLDQHTSVAGRLINVTASRILFTFAWAQPSAVESGDTLCQSCTFCYRWLQTDCCNVCLTVYLQHARKDLAYVAVSLS